MYKNYNKRMLLSWRHCCHIIPNFLTFIEDISFKKCTSWNKYSCFLPIIFSLVFTRISNRRFTRSRIPGIMHINLRFAIQVYTGCKCSYKLIVCIRMQTCCKGSVCRKADTCKPSTNLCPIWIFPMFCFTWKPDENLTFAKNLHAMRTCCKS